MSYCRFLFFTFLLFILNTGTLFSQNNFRIDSIRLVGEKQIPFKATFKNTVIGGLSGIDRAPDGDYYLISDDRSHFSPARFYIASLFFDQTKFDSIQIKDAFFFKRPDSSLYPENSLDPESIRYHHDTFIGPAKAIVTKAISLL